jgi:hypothetical protein
VTEMQLADKSMMSLNQILLGASRFGQPTPIYVTCPYPEPDRSSPCAPSHFSKIPFNIILPSTSPSHTHTLAT